MQRHLDARRCLPREAVAGAEAVAVTEVVAGAGEPERDERPPKLITNRQGRETAKWCMNPLH